MAPIKLCFLGHLTIEYVHALNFYKDYKIKDCFANDYANWGNRKIKGIQMCDS